MTFGEKIKTLRNEKGWSQDELAKKLGVNRRAISCYENGTSYPRTMERYQQLAEIFGVEVNYLRTENEVFMEEVGAQYERRGILQAKDILEQTAQLFAGGSLSDEDQLAFMTEMQQLYLDSKQRAKKYTPKKYLKVQLPDEE